MTSYSINVKSLVSKIIYQEVSRQEQHSFQHNISKDIMNQTIESDCTQILYLHDPNCTDVASQMKNELI